MGPGPPAEGNAISRGDLLGQGEGGMPELIAASDVRAARLPLDGVHAGLVLLGDVLDVPKPVVGKAYPVAPQRGADAAAAVVPADDDSP
jgi:hypothetical protein